MEKELKIGPEKLLIQGNIMAWQDNMIQLSNVSFVSASEVSALPFPTYSLLVLLGGIILLYFTLSIGILVLILYALSIVCWYMLNEEHRNGLILTILLDSGHSFQLVFQNREFVQEVLKLLMEVLADGNKQNRSILINIGDCTIEEKENVLNELNIVEKK